jgi:hypothetical protein
MFARDVFVVGGVLRDEGTFLEERDVFREVLLTCEVLDIAEKHIVGDARKRILDPTIGQYKMPPSATIRAADTTSIPGQSGLLMACGWPAFKRHCTASPDLLCAQVGIQIDVLSVVALLTIVSGFVSGEGWVSGRVSWDNRAIAPEEEASHLLGLHVSADCLWFIHLRRRWTFGLSLTQRKKLGKDARGETSML